jgi:histidinol phosphatase-like enzyme
MLAKYSLAPAEVWMIGDRLNDVQAGLNAGVRSAMIAREAAAVLPAGVWHCRSLGEFRERVGAGVG